MVVGTGRVVKNATSPLYPFGEQLRLTAIPDEGS
jgi:hypothetical protein